MAYGTVKVDSITFTNGGSDQTITVSGIVESISGNITATGTIQGATIIGTSTVSGATVTGDSGQYGNLNSISGVFTTQLSGATITGDIGQYATLTGISGVFTTQISGATITGNTIQASTVTGISGVYTTQLSGATITGDAGNYSELTAISGVFTTQVSGATVTGDAGSFTTVTGGVATITSGVFALGTNALPSISFSSDPNTGIYSPGADQLALSTNGTGRLFVDASGNLLHGGTLPSTPNITLTAGGNISFISANSGDKGLRSDDITGFGSAAIFFTGVGANQSTDIRFLTGSSPGSEAMNERLRITSAGLVGIGTSGPQYLTHVFGGSDSTNNNLLTVQSNGVASDGTLSTNIRLINSTATSSLHGAEIRAIRATSTTADLSIRLYDTSGSIQDKVYVTGSGRVGIGTTSPSSILHVKNDTGSTVSLLLENASVSASAYTQFRALGDAGSIIMGYAGNGSGGTGVYEADYGYLTSESTAAGLNIGAVTGPIRFFANSTSSERARIDSSGRLLVGTSSDSGGALLQVNGNRVRIATAKTPASASDTGTAGEVCWDTNYIYVCTATNTWKRAALSTW